LVFIAINDYAWCMTTLRNQRTKPGEILCLKVYIYQVLPLLTYN